MDTPTIELIPLGQLMLGDGEGEGVIVDSRLTGRDIGIADMAASIKEHGLLQPLAVWRDPTSGKEFVAIGNRRLRALRLLRDEAQLPPDWPTPCRRLHGSMIDALEASAAENIDREDLHPVDVFEVTKLLAMGGMKPAELARRFRVSPKEIKQRLALGCLTSDVLEAWRAGTIDEATARAFTLEPDQPTQARLFGELKEAGHISAWRVRERILGEQHGAGKLLAFVGGDAYAAAGGRLVVDLFDDKKGVLDRPILDQLAKDRLAAVVEATKAEGWGTVLTEFERPADWYSYESAGEPVLTEDDQKALDALEKLPHHERWGAEVRIKEAARIAALTPEQRAGTVSLVTITHDGLTHIEYGRLPPQPKAAKAKGEDGAQAAGDGEPGRVVDQLRDTLTVALAESFVNDSDAALRLALASLMAGRHKGSPLHFWPDGLAAILEAVPQPQAHSFAFAVEQVGNMPGVEVMRLLARCIASGLDAGTAARNTSASFGRSVSAEGVELAASLVLPQELGANLRKHFNAVAYFSGAKKDHGLKAIAEALGEDAAKAWGKAKKADLEVFCLANIPQTGWLPAELRFPGYVNPASRKFVIDDPRAHEVQGDVGEFVHSLHPPAESKTPLGDRAAVAVDSVKRKRASRKAAAEKGGAE